MLVIRREAFIVLGGWSGKIIYYYLQSTLIIGIPTESMEGAQYWTGNISALSAAAILGVYTRPCRGLEEITTSNVSARGE